MICAVCLSLMTLSEVLDTSLLHSLSRAWQFGRAIYRAKQSQCNVIEAIITQQQGLLLLTGKVSMKRLVSIVSYILVTSTLPFYLVLFATSKEKNNICYLLHSHILLFII